MTLPPSLLADSPPHKHVFSTPCLRAAWGRRPVG